MEILFEIDKNKKLKIKLDKILIQFGLILYNKYSNIQITFMFLINNILNLMF